MDLLNLELLKFCLLIATPLTATGNLPAKLLLGRNFHTRFDLLKPNIAEHVEKTQWNQKISHDNSVQSQPFQQVSQF